MAAAAILLAVPVAAWSFDSGAATFWLMLASQAVLWAMAMRGDLLKKGRSDGADAASMQSLTEAINQFAKAIEKLDEWKHTHSLDDERRFTKLEEFRADQAETNRHLSDLADNFSKQITNVALGLAPAAAVELPANRRGRV